MSDSNPPVIDWHRIDLWTRAIVADDAAPIAPPFLAAGGEAPEFQWQSTPPTTHPPLSFLFDHWLKLKSGLAMPNARELDPLDLKPALGHLMLLDPVDGGRDFRFRLYGTLVAEISGMDMTGKLFSQFPASAHVVAFGIASTRAVLARAEPLYSTRKPMMAERTTRWQRLALPLADEGGAVARVVVATVAVGRSGEMLRKLRM